MGWLWSSAPSGDNPPPKSSSRGNEERGLALTEEQRQRIFGKPSSAPSGSSTTPQDSDKDLEAFINSFDTSPKPSPVSGDAHPSPDEPEPEPTPLSRTLPDGRLSIAPEHLYPRTMSCRQAFDQAFYCQSLGGKFNDIYRFGKVQSCSEQWNAFWFCMRNRTLPMKNKEEVFAGFYEERDRRRKREWGSSEDVWPLREVAVERAFWRDPDEEEEREAKGRGVEE